MFKKPFALLTIALLAFVLGSPQNSFGQSPDDQYQNTGGILPNAKQEAKFHATHSHITAVHTNPLGLYRVNRERAKKRLPLIDHTKALPFGNEIETQQSNNNQPPGGPSPLPGSVDNATDVITSPYFPPIGNQTTHLDCQSWAVIYYQLTYMNAMSKGWTVSNGDTTKIFSPRWVYSIINGGVDEGAWEGQVYPVIEMNGSATLSDFSSNTADNHLAWDLNPDHWQHALSVRTNPVAIVAACPTCTAPTQVTTAEVASWITNMKGLLNNGYILTFQNYIHQWLYTTVTGASDNPSLIGQNVAYAQSATTYDAGHVMTIVGYDDTLTFSVSGHTFTGAFKIANQWGTGYENSGYVWLAYDALYTTSQACPSCFTAGKYDSNSLPTTGRTQAIWNTEAYEVTVKPNYTPRLIAKFTVNQTQRGQLQMFLGTSATTASTPTTTNLNIPAGPYPSALDQDGGALSFNGSSSCAATKSGQDPTACNTPVTQTACNALAVADGCYWIPAYNGVAATCWGACSRVGSSVCSTQVPAGCSYTGNSACWGTAVSCSNLNSTACSSQAGCSLVNGACTGSASACTTLSSTACTTQAGCQSTGSGTFVLDFTDFLPCAGTASACGTIVNASACASQAGCSWGSGVCTGTATACSTLTPLACSSQAGCQSGGSGALKFYLGMTDHKGVCSGFGWNYLGDILNTPSACTTAAGYWQVGNSSTISSYKLIDLTTNTTTQATGLPVSASGSTVYSPITYTFLGHVPPVAYATATPASGAYPLTVSFDASGSKAASGSTISSYTWNFGDGNTVSTSSATVSHTYTNVGYNPAVLTVTDNLGATATYTFPTAILVQPLITAGAGTNGSISPSGNISLNLGGSQAFVVTANSGYSVYQVLVDNKAVVTESSYTSSYTYTFSNVKAYHTITATFNPVITVSAGTGGTFSPTGNVPVVSGTNKSFTITPGTGKAAVISLDGKPAVTAQTNSYTINNVIAPHTLAVSFIPYITVTASAGTGGTISPSGAVKVGSGIDQTFAFSPNTGYGVSQVLVDGASVTLISSNQYTLSHVITTHTIAVSFAPIVVSVLNGYLVDTLTQNP